MAKKCNKGSECGNNRKTVTIDITDIYDDIKLLAKEEIRTIEGEVLYLIKKGIQNNSNNTYINYMTPPYNFSHFWDEPIMAKSTSPIDNTVYASKVSRMRPINEDVPTDTIRGDDGIYVVD